jgi:hypothetical protein
LASPGKGAFEGFGGFDAGLNEQVGDQSGTAGLRLVVGGVMQAHAVLLVRVPPVGTHEIVGVGELLQRHVQSIALLTLGLKFEPNCSIHNTNATLYGIYCQRRVFQSEWNACGSSQWVKHTGNTGVPAASYSYLMKTDAWPAPNANAYKHLCYLLVHIVFGLKSELSRQ